MIPGYTPLRKTMKHIQAFFDGSCEPINPGGTVRYGFAVIEDECVIKAESGLIGKGDGMTNNVSEYQGLIHLLGYLQQNHEHDLIEVFGDSKMVILMTKGVWGKKKPHKSKKHLKPLLMRARELYNSFENISIDWIPREQNQLADFLSKK